MIARIMKKGTKANIIKAAIIISKRRVLSFTCNNFINSAYYGVYNIFTFVVA